MASVAIPAKIKAQIQVDDSFPQVKADLQLLKRVLVNLLTNAVQAMPEGGKLNLNHKLIVKGKYL